MDDDHLLPVEVEEAEASWEYGTLLPQEQLADVAKELADDALSPATRSAYKADWNRWLSWCRVRGFDPLGASGPLALYLAEMVTQGKKVPTIDRALSAIALAYRLQDKPNPRQDPAVSAVFKGARRRIGVAPEQMTAILPTQLQKMIEGLPQTKHEKLRSARNRAALVLGFCGGFRRSELLALDWDDIYEVPEGLKIHIRRSKTDQEGRGRWIGLPYASVLSVCPVRAYKDWLEVSGVEGGPIFRTISKDGLTVLDTRLCTRQFADIVKSSAQRVGLVGKFGGHSLRAGLVTAAMQAKKNPKAIMAQTGHRTMDILLRYVREQGLFEDNPAAGLL